MQTTSIGYQTTSSQPVGKSIIQSNKFKLSIWNEAGPIEISTQQEVSLVQAY